MALDTAGLKVSLKALLLDMLTRENNSIDDFVNGLGNMIEVYVKTADVKAGITVTTSGSATTQTGSTTSLGKLI